MVKKTLIAIVLLIAVGLILAYLNRVQIMLFVASVQDREPVAENREIVWEQGPTEPLEDREVDQPNIIFILADDMGINDVSTFGGGVANGRVPTTHIDRLAREGANFLQSYAGNATCAPSRAQLMTGRYPTRTGFEFTPTPPGLGRTITFITSGSGVLPPVEFNAEQADLMPDFDGQGLPTEEVTVAELLREKGYHTVLIGKWHLGGTTGTTPIDQGFNESLRLEGLLYGHEDDENIVNAKLDFDPLDQFLWARGGFGASYNNSDLFEPSHYLTDYYTDEALKVIEANKNRPFFLYLSHWGPHAPLQATVEDYEAVGDIKPHRLRVYAAMIRSIDRSVGKVMDKLVETGLDENTLIVFSSDNGGTGNVGLDDLNAPYRGWKITFFEGGIRAPLFMRWPARIKPNTQIETPVAHIDVMPTLIEAGGASIPDDIVIDGKSLLSAATGEGPVGRGDEPLFWQSGYTQAVRSGDWKLQVEYRRNKAWLFNLKDDPTEQHNLAFTMPEKVDELKAMLAEHQEDRFGPLYPHSIESPIPIDIHSADTATEDSEYVYWPN